MARLAVFLGAVVLVPSLALAQTKALEDKKGIAFNEIERGFFLEGGGGFWGTINPPAGQGSKQYFLPGQAVRVAMGFDLGDRISLALTLSAASTYNASSDYTGLSGGKASGDFSVLAPGAELKVRLVGFDDSQRVKRTWFYLRGGAASVFYSPASLLPTRDILVTAGPGVEYFTRLRHFSIGVEASFNFMLLTQSLGFSVLPSVRYAF